MGLEISILILFLIGFGIILRILNIKDTRENYLKDRISGLIYALEISNNIDHKEILHNGIPHQNPYVYLGKSYYPLTYHKYCVPNIRALVEKVKNIRDVKVVLVGYENMFHRIEDITQAERGVFI